MIPEGGPAPDSLLKGYMSEVFEHETMPDSSLAYKTAVLRGALDANVLQVQVCLCTKLRCFSYMAAQ